ncbi:protein MRG1-like isoform X2 [Alnus glutinosa]|uniref:protein MRG1-like isoform X2 n=1 Tax=Alnus glutinosa TaxID=3517 RepID=UPI002D77129B|nr:protein MRG1-like isoform X2 [Alnus glutinosa]
MGSSKTGVTDSSATESDGAVTKTDSDVDIDDDGDCDFDYPPNTDSCPFLEGEKVLAFHNLCVYEAKVRKIEYRGKEWSFLVHYPGWSKNWDEWVGMDRLMKFTEENVQKQKGLNKKQFLEKNTKLPRSSLIKPKSSNVGRAKKRKNDSIKEKGTIPLDKLVNIQLPPPLKKQLVDDCEFITHLGKLVKLPRTPNVDDILRKYLDYRLKKDGLIADSLREILKGLHRYFDKALPVILLYKSERQQYDEAISDDVSPSTVYGAEHLLRLFVKLPELLYYANIEEETLMELQQKLVDFLKFLQKHQSAFFLSTYHVPEDVETSTNKEDD